jgi:hypothetical protein
MLRLHQTGYNDPIECTSGGVPSPFERFSSALGNPPAEGRHGADVPPQGRRCDSGCQRRGGGTARECLNHGA